MNVDPATIASFFTGGYGLDLAIERLLPNSKPVILCEREAFACELLASKMEDGTVAPAPICTDIREVDGRAWHGLVDCVVGGFPCTDISTAGGRAGITGEHSGLWFELARVIGEMGPAVCFLENVSALTVRGIDAVLGSLAELGFDAEWGCLRASDVGASHERNRIFILAYARRLGVDGLKSKLLGWGCRAARAGAGGDDLADAERSERRSSEPGGNVRHGDDAGRSEEADRAGAHRGEVGHAQGIAGRSGWGREREGARSRRADPRGSDFEVADTHDSGLREQRTAVSVGAKHAAAQRSGGTLADTASQRCGEGRTEREGLGGEPALVGADGALAHPDRDRLQVQRRELPEDRDAQSRRHADGRRTADPPPGPHDAAGWAAYLRAFPGLEPSVRRGSDGLAYRLDRLRMLGNGVVPDQAEWAFRQLIGRALT